jgi:transcriptional regulator with XRE-family HTH domain
MKHSEFSKSAIVARFSQRTRNLLLFTAYQCVLEGEERAWNKHGERYEHLHPRERLAQYLGVHKSHLSNYFNGRTAIPDDVAERAFDLIPEHLQPYFAIQELCAVLIDLAQLFPKYRQPHEFEFFWNLPHLAERAGRAWPRVGRCGCGMSLSGGRGSRVWGRGRSSLVRTIMGILGCGCTTSLRRGSSW